MRDGEQWLSIGQAAKWLDVHLSTLRRWADNGEIEFLVTPGGHRRFATTTLAEFAERQKRSRRKSADAEKQWANNALTVTRQSLAASGESAWLAQPEAARERHRVLGRRLMGLTMQFIAAEQDEQDDFWHEAQQIGQEYAQVGIESGLALPQMLEASLFFRDTLVETALQPTDGVRLRPEAGLRLMRKINQLLNVVHLAIAEGYDAHD